MVKFHNGRHLGSRNGEDTILEDVKFIFIFISYQLTNTVSPGDGEAFELFSSTKIQS